MDASLRRDPRGQQSLLPIVCPLCETDTSNRVHSAFLHFLQGSRHTVPPYRVFGSYILKRLPLRGNTFGFQNSILVLAPNYTAVLAVVRSTRLSRINLQYTPKLLYKSRAYFLLCVKGPKAMNL